MIESSSHAEHPRKEAVVTLAGMFHEQWQQTRLRGDGTLEPRIKATEDGYWAATHGSNQVDIANTSFPELPADWQAESRAAAEVALGVLYEAGGVVDLADEIQRTRAGDTIHQAWLSRNKWAAGSELDVPFSQLPPDEQAKDLSQVIIAQQFFQQ